MGMNRGQFARLTRVRKHQGPQPPQVETPPQITSAIPGVYRVGVVVTATDPTFTPAGATVVEQWFVAGEAVVGEVADTYTPVAGDATKTLFKRWTATDPVTGLSTSVETPIVGPIEAAATSLAPVVADRTGANAVEFGVLTLPGAGAVVPINTGGDIDGLCEITAGNALGHFQIDAVTGAISPTEAGRAAGLPGPYSLELRLPNAHGAATPTYEIVPEAAAYDIASAAEMTAARADIGAAAEPRWIRPRDGVSLAWTAAWFDNPGHTAMVTLQPRTVRGAKLTGLGFPTSTRFNSPKNLCFQDMVLQALYHRRQQRNNGIILWEGTPENVDFINCYFETNEDQLAPGAGFWGWTTMSNGPTTNLDNLHIRFLKCDFNGCERTFVLGNPKFNNAPGPIVEMDGCDIWNLGNDGPTTSGYWQYVKLTNSRIHSPYIDVKRVYFFSGPSYVWKRATPWDGAANGKKLLFNTHLDFKGSAVPFARTIYAEGGETTPTLEIYREATTGFIHVIVRDSAGNVLMDQATTNPIGKGGTEQMNLLVDIDTDRPSEGIKVHLWREKDLGGGEWVEKMTAETSGQLLNLTAGSISLGGRYDGSNSAGPGNTSYLLFKRIALWYGQCLATDNDRDAFVNSTTGFVGPWATIQATYGTPTMYHEGRANDWRLNNMGNGGAWSTFNIGAATTGHGDGIQTLYNSTVTGHLSENLIIAAFKDRSPKYDRPADPDHTIEYDQLQGYFGEDMNSGNNVVGATYRNILICCGSGHGFSPYNLKNCIVDKVAVFVLERWGLTDINYPNVRLMLSPPGDPAATAGGNLVTDCWGKVVNTSYPAGSDTITGSVTDQVVIPATETIDTVDQFLAYAVSLGAVQDVGQ